LYSFACYRSSPFSALSQVFGPRHLTFNGFAIRQGKWKLIHGVGPHGRVKERVKNLPADHPIGELYDMPADPGETKNLWDERQDVLKQLLALLE
jgi:arylsulfatase A